MIAFENEHGVLDCRLACSINQSRAFEHDPSSLGLSVGTGANNKHRQEGTQDHERVGTIHFHLAPPI
jgi:hypothetical protein